MARSMTSQANDLQDLLSIISQEVPKIGHEDSQSSETSRMEALRACEKMCMLLHDPFEWLFVESAAYIFPATISVVLEIGVLKYVSQDVAHPSHVEELAKVAGASSELLGRMFRILTKRFVLEEVIHDHYVHNDLSRLLLTPSVEAWIGLSADDNLKASAALMPLLKDNKFQIPEDDGSCAFSRAFNTPFNQFRYYGESDPERGRRAASSMAAFNATTMFRNFPFPFGELPPGGIIVDVGGGGGHVSADIAQKHSHLKFVVQDMAESINLGKSNQEFSKLPIEWQVQGLFEEQSVRGADAYIIRHVLHGFQDKIASQIIRRVSEAMDPGRSRILIIDCVVPDLLGSDSLPFVNTTDILALLGGNGKQRSRKQWDSLVKLADPRLAVVKVWNDKRMASADAVIEIKMTQ